jgi:inner membrane protein
MPTAITHAAVAVAANFAFSPRNTLRKFGFLALFCSVIPDVDILGFFFGLPYGHFLAHRGFFHSPFFSLTLTLLIMVVFFRSLQIFSKGWLAYFLFFFLLSITHGFLDGLTNGGLGVAFFAPFDSGRYFLPWTPILVSPIGIRSFFSRRGWEVIKSELVWVWLPSFFLAIIGRWMCVAFRNHQEGTPNV